MKVLSLFDGMSCGQIALKELGITPEIYYSSEIDKFTIKQTMLNFPNTVQLGDVEGWRDWDIDWQDIDLLLAGSPCQGFSFAGKQLAFDDPRSKLFFVFIDILNFTRNFNPDVKFLLENVNMKKEHMKIISHYCGVYPVNINSNLVSAQNRNRWYWTNIRTKYEENGDIYSDIPQPQDRCIYLRDILDSEVDDKYYVSQATMARMLRNNQNFRPRIDPDKTGCITTKNNSAQMSFNSGTTFISIDGKAPTQRCSTGRSLDSRHNYQFIQMNIDKEMDNNQSEAYSEIDSICVAMRGREACLTQKRTEYGKIIRKDYESGTIKEPRNIIQQLEPRNDGKTNCITSVQKDNLILQRPRGYNTGAIFERKTPTLSCHAWEQNNLLLLNDRQMANYKSVDEKANTFLSTSYKGSQANGMTLIKDIIQINPNTDSGGTQPYQQDRIYNINGIAPTLCAGHGGMSPNIKTNRIRRLTPIECARLQTIPDWYIWECSDTQIYRMLGNGWTVEVIKHILSFLEVKTMEVAKEPQKEDRRLRNLKYQMRKKGYVINDKDRVCILADEDKRSSLQEKKIKTFSFRLQYKML